MPLSFQVLTEQRYKTILEHFQQIMRNNESEGISIVISSHKNKGLHNDGNAHIIEYDALAGDMGEGEGAQAYGWVLTYVTEVEGIGRTYAIHNTTTHIDALRALQHDVDAISDQLNRHRDNLKYDEEQLKRANEWRAEAELDYDYRQ